MRYFQNDDNNEALLEVKPQHYSESKAEPTHQLPRPLSKKQSGYNIPFAQQVLQETGISAKTLVGLCMELAVTPYSSDMVKLPSSDTFDFNMQDAEGLLQVLQWRVEKQVSQNEFSALYIEWLKRKGISREKRNLMNVHCFITAQNQQHCLNDLKSQVKQMLDKMNIKSDDQVLAFLQIIQNEINSIIIDSPDQGIDSNN